MGEGLRRRPRHPDARRPRGAAAGPDARARRRLPRRRPRGRDGRGVRLLPARQGRRRPVDRHRDARPRRRRARRPPAPRLRHRDRDGRRRRAADQGGVRRQGRVGAVASPGLPARPRHRGHQGGQPAGHRLHPRRPRHHRVGRHQRAGREELALDHPHRRALHQAALEEAAVRCPREEVRAARPREASRPRRRDRPAAARRRLGRPPHGRPLHRRQGRPRLPRLEEHAAPGRARHVVPRPLPAHQGQADGARPRPRRVAGQGARPGRRAARGLPRRLRVLLRPQREGARR